MKISSNYGVSIFVSFLVFALVAIWLAMIALVAYGIYTRHIFEFWQSVNEGQASILSALVSGIALLTSALLIPFVFKDRIRDLDSAVEQMQSTISIFEADAKQRLDSLVGLVKEKTNELEQKGNQDADRIASLLEEIRSAVILSFTQGQISDPKYAKVLARHLYNDATNVAQSRLRDKPYLHEATRQKIRQLRTMSSGFLDSLVSVNAINKSEKDVIDKIKLLAYRRADFTVHEINELNRVRAEFDRLFGDNGVVSPDA